MLEQQAPTSTNKCRDVLVFIGVFIPIKSHLSIHLSLVVKKLIWTSGQHPRTALTRTLEPFTAFLNLGPLKQNVTR